MSSLGSNELFNPYARLELVEIIENYRSISPEQPRLALRLEPNQVGRKALRVEFGKAISSITFPTAPNQ